MHSALACASAFSGLLSAAIIHMDGVAHKPGWSWIFLLASFLAKRGPSSCTDPIVQEGLFIVVVAILAFFLLPDSPTTAVMIKDSEKAIIADTLRDDGILVQGAERGYFWSEFGRIFTQPHILLLVLVDVFYGESPRYCNAGHLRLLTG